MEGKNKEENFLMNVLKTLKKENRLDDLAAEVLAKEIAQHVEHYVEDLQSVQPEYLKMVFSRLNYVILDKFYQCKLN
jgi:hypothetical protein